MKNMKLLALALTLMLSACKTTLDTQKFIQEAYKSKNGIISDEEREMITNSGGGPVYGEILYSSLKTLLDDMQVTSTDVFYDLGSGLGKVTIQAYMDYPFSKAVGIELSPTRFKHSDYAKEQLQKKNGISEHKTLEFKNEDINKSDLSDATIVFMCSTCFPDSLMLSLAEKLSHLKKGLKVLTLRQLPQAEANGFKLVKEYSLPMTWSNGSPVYYYQLN